MMSNKLDQANAVFDGLYTKLNPQQKLAVDTVEGPVMVLAGPGTGKTQILAMRIANILRNPDLQMSPHNILCLTFTTSGVTAMRNRLISIIGPDAYYVRIHTFHSFCNEVIQDYPEDFFGLEQISDLEQLEIIDEIIDKLDTTSPIKPFGSPYFYRDKILSMIKKLKQEFIKVSDLSQAITTLEDFLAANQSTIEDFIATNARNLKEEDCFALMEEIKVRSSDEQRAYALIIEKFWQEAQKITEFKNKIKTLYQDNGQKQIPKLKELAHCYQRYLEILEQRKLYDYEDMILKVIKGFETKSDMLADYQEQFQYILVDEYQDTNGSQNKVIELLCSYYQENPNIFVVGDDDQSIYKFQGASLENIYSFFRTYQSQLKLVVLEDNYRSQQTILDAASSCIKYNHSRLIDLPLQHKDAPTGDKKASSRNGADTISSSKQLNSQRPDLELNPIEICEYDNYPEELYGTALKIEKLIASGIAAEEIAVLFRNNRDSEQLVDILSRKGIPYSIEAGENILNDIEITQLLDLLKVINKPEANDLLFGVLSSNFVVEHLSNGNKQAHIQTIYELNRHKKELNESNRLIDQLLKHDELNVFANQILDFQAKATNLKFDKFFELVVQDFGYLSYILKQDDKIDKLNKLDTLFDEIKRLCRSPYVLNSISKQKQISDSSLKRFTLQDFVSYLDLMLENGIKIKANLLKSKTQAVRLMTAHGSKGLEYEHVFIHKCINKHWGNKGETNFFKLPPALLSDIKTQSQEDKNEEERRLFFVALTRAKCKVHISYHKQDDKGKELVPSMFVEEIHPELKTKHSSKDIFDKDAIDEINRLIINFESHKQNPNDLILEEKAYIDSLLEHYKLSVTHLNNYLNCPRKFFYQNLMRVPAAKDKNASFGTAVHNALKDLFEAFGSGADLRTLLLTNFELHLNNEFLPAKEHQECLNYGREILTKYFDHYQNEFSQNNLLEYDLGRFGLNLDGIQLAGKLDKIEISKDKTINVVDYKTGKANKSKLKPGKDYHRQIAFYQLLCDLGREAKVFDYHMVSGEIDFVKADDNGKLVKFKINISSDELNDLKKEIHNVHECIQNHEFEMTQDHNECARCSFKKLCQR